MVVVRLTSLTIEGFKSFAHETDIVFVPGMTAVVGPNGSGKSNVADALRWVFGEHSAKPLRGGTMHELIFAGCDDRAPSAYAEVRIRLDNRDRTLAIDADTVTVLRRMYRSGEAECAINALPCRLKDITELFMDTGIGAHSLAVIGQGRIDEVLSSKPEERRALFDEVAGITKGKARKKEALRKLIDTDANIVRLTDIITELQAQIAPLTLEAQKARTYEALNAERIANEMALLVFDVGVAHQELCAAEATHAHEYAQEARLQDDIAVQEACIEQHMNAMQCVDIDALQSALQEEIAAYERATKAHALCVARRAHACEMMEETQRHIAHVRAQAAADEEESSALLARIRSMTQQYAQYATLLAEEVRDDSQQDVEQRLHKSVMEAMHMRAQLTHQQHQNQAHYDACVREEARLNSQRAALNAQHHALERDRLACAHAAREHKAAWDTARSAIEDKQQAIAQQEQQRFAIDEQMQTCTAHIASHQARLHTLHDVHDTYDGFAIGVRAVMTAVTKGVLSHVHGAIASLVSVAETYERAIETALGAAMQHIVVRDEAAAREAISFLKKTNQGRATFLPLDIIRGKIMADVHAVLALPGWIGVAAQLVHVDPLYEMILAHVLGNVGIVQSLEEGSRIARALSYRYRIVTLDGDVIGSGGAMTGGSVRTTNAPLLARKRQLTELERALAALHAQQETLRVQRAALQEELDRARAALSEAHTQSEAQHTAWQQQEAMMQQHSVRLRDIAQARTVIDAEQRDLDATRQTLGQARIHIERDIAHWSQRVTEEEQQLLEVRARIRDESTRDAQERMQWRVEHARLEEAIGAAQARFAQLGSSDVAQTLQAYEAKCADVQAHICALDLEHEAHIETLRAIDAARQTRADALERARTTRNGAMQALTDAQEVLGALRMQQGKHAAAMRACEAHMHRARAALEYGLTQLAQSAKMSYERAKQHYPLTGDVDDVRRTTAHLAERIAALGHVHVGAIEEHARMQERMAFLAAQRDDVRAAQQQLMSVIRDIDADMEAKFTQAFASIRAHVQDVFVALFGGGSADVQLSDPRDILQSGIDILAQPPGKKRQNMQLLSGGERALTALCVLFAVLRYKPLPFCVLDEVDAALDEANGMRFAQFLQTFAAHTQFIVITHRKTTMAAADALYGMTMEQRGVSKLISVQFVSA